MTKTISHTAFLYQNGFYVLKSISRLDFHVKMDYQEDDTDINSNSKVLSDFKNSYKYYIQL